MRISDWSSDVCSSDLHRDRHWREGLALDSLEGEQRREHHEDDRLPEQRRADHLLYRTLHLLESLAHVEFSPLLLIVLPLFFSPFSTSHLFFLLFFFFFFFFFLFFFFLLFSFFFFFSLFFSSFFFFFFF